MAARDEIREKRDRKRARGKRTLGGKKIEINRAEIRYKIYGYNNGVTYEL